MGAESGRGFAFIAVARLAAEEVTAQRGIPVTTLARTLLDLADVLHPQALRRAITEAEYRGRFDLTSLNAVVENNPGRRGAKVMGGGGRGRHRTRSPLEDRFLAFMSDGASRSQRRMSGSRVTRWTSYGEELALWWSWTGLRRTGRGRL